LQLLLLLLLVVMLVCERGTATRQLRQMLHLRT
jgi:hypothetical protein